MTILLQESNQLPKQKPISLLPLLVVLFLISYAMLAYLVVQQASTIGTQRTLIRQLLGDSVELSSLKVKALQAQAQAKAQAQSQPQPETNTVKPKATMPRKARPEAFKPRKPVPEKPSKNTGVLLDTRRVTNTL